MIQHLVGNRKIILASNSPRRRELLAGLGLDFEVRTLQGIDESWPSDLQGEDIPKHISAKKAAAYLPTLADEELLITADTIVYLDHQVLGKPKDADEARAMLKRLNGRTHEVITGVTIATQAKQTTFAVTSLVTFADLTDEEIDHYVEHYKPFDKAGAYGIQEWIGYIGVTRLEGSYFNVMGLPVQRLYTELRRF
ncbi:MAG: septum formation protein Maf [Bacteroidaceae bacterium]|nr:septum formation protein Maf [Bacteroidaceae bacterium]